MLQYDSNIFTYCDKLIYLSIYHIIVLSNTIFAKNISHQPWTSHATLRHADRPLRTDHLVGVGTLAALSDIFWLGVVGTSHFSQQVAQVLSTNHKLEWNDMNLAHKTFNTDILFEEGISALRIRLACFVVYSAANIDKVRECHHYIMYIKTVFSNNCPCAQATCAHGLALLAALII